MIYVPQFIQTSKLISQTQFIFMIFNGFKWLQVKINFSNSFESAHKNFDVWNEVAFTAEISMWATQSWFMGQPELDMLDLI